MTQDYWENLFQMVRACASIWIAMQLLVQSIFFLNPCEKAVFAILPDYMYMDNFGSAYEYTVMISLIIAIYKLQ